MCAGDEYVWVNQMMTYRPQKGNEKAVFKCTHDIRFYISFFSIGMPYYQEGLDSRVSI